PSGGAARSRRAVWAPSCRSARAARATPGRSSPGQDPRTRAWRPSARRTRGRSGRARAAASPATSLVVHQDLGDADAIAITDDDGLAARHGAIVDEQLE